MFLIMHSIAQYVVGSSLVLHENVLVYLVFGGSGHLCTHDVNEV